MKSKRRDFIIQTGLASLSVMGMSPMNPIISKPSIYNTTRPGMNENQLSIIGEYGPWAAGLMDKKLPKLSFRNSRFTEVNAWRKTAKAKLFDRLGIPDTGPLPKVTLIKKSVFDGLSIEEITWQLPYGRPTEAVVLKPSNAKGPLPGVLAFHDHGGNKYFGTKKITKTGDEQHPMMVSHQKEYYEGKAWANELAKRGYVVMVSDAFTFGSRRVLMQDIPEKFRVQDNTADDQANIDTYNHWAGNHEHIMSKSLFCAGTTWPGVFFAEDRKALDVLCGRADVDKNKIGCAGLSGGGLRSVFMGGIDERIKVAIPVGFMTTWKDFLFNKSYTHTWMTYVPILPNELDFPEILGLRVPMATMVLNDSEDELYTLPEMQRANRILSDIFTKAKATERYQCNFHPGPHKFDLKMQGEAFEWFDKWLK